ncbi:Glycoside hydrolase [Parasponia andersonii]|uniref:endo-polygalacturonase n=1 Tax=Parasponia andersonii TaxID=3476 RepID=A0A2P5A7G2_PARAD|nr:Glycoside hydrolase [Parasponia andersonii]
MSNLEEVVKLHDHHILVEETSENDFLKQAYPSYFGMVEDGKFKGLIKVRTDVLSLEKVGGTPTSVKMVNVKNFGAKGDGNDDTEAFEKAWEAACSSKGGAVMVVPEGNTYLLKPIRFLGPCKSKNVIVQILGTIKASDDQSDYKKDGRYWLRFDRVAGLIVEGGGTVNGNGEIWWQNSCKINKDLPCKDAPTALTFYNCKNLVVKNLNIQDSQQIHLSFEKCLNVQASNLSVTAPEKSPNTDGIHVTNTQNIQISNSVIGTGDDCISIVSGSQNVQVTDITCGPGHGISIGSLGAKYSEAYVSGITVNRAKLIGTTNGARIKTWQGGSGTATNITFENIEMENVANPIIIDQNYCDQKNPCSKQQKAVQVKNVLYKSISGTSASQVAIKFDCSSTFPCQGIVLQDIDLKLQGKEGEQEEAKAVCSNVKVSNIGTVSPQCY